jgi:hypothetical protein
MVARSAAQDLGGLHFCGINRELQAGHVLLAETAERTAVVLILY